MGATPATARAASNISDSLLWLDYFSRSADIRVDAMEDYALDLAHRMTAVPPYSQMPPADRRALAYAALDVKDSETRRATCGAWPTRRSTAARVWLR